MSTDGRTADPRPSTDTGPPSCDRRTPRRQVLVLRAAARGLFVLGGVLLGLVGLSQISATVYQRVEESRLAAWLSHPGDAGDGAMGPPVGRIEIPRLGLSAMIAEGIDPATLLLAAGHVPGTALPGRSGNVVLGGHRDTFFRGLKGIRKGDVVSITTPAGSYRYQVESTSVIKPEQTEVLAQTSEPTLTLITCYPFRYVGSAPKRFVVRARLIDAPSQRALLTIELPTWHGAC